MSPADEAKDGDNPEWKEKVRGSKRFSVSLFGGLNKHSNSLVTSLYFTILFLSIRSCWAINAAQTYVANNRA